MQTPRPINDPSTGLVGLVAILLSALLLLGQSRSSSRREKWLWSPPLAR